MSWLSNHRQPGIDAISDDILAMLMVSTPGSRENLARELAPPGTIPSNLQMKALELIWSGQADRIVKTGKDTIDLPLVMPL